MIEDQKWMYLIVYKQEHSSYCSRKKSDKIYDDISEALEDIQADVDILKVKEATAIVDIEIIPM